MHLLGMENRFSQKRIIGHHCRAIGKFLRVAGDVYPRGTNAFDAVYPMAGDAAQSLRQLFSQRFR